MIATNVDKTIRVLLVDDHPMVLSGIRQFLASRENINIVGEASNGEEAITQAKMLEPHVILMDISMPVMNGIEATKRLRTLLPNSRIIILTMHENREYIAQFVDCGARGYVLKKTSPEELIQAIEAVHRGEAFFSPAAAATLLGVKERSGPEYNSTGARALSARERQVLILIASGKSTKGIAEELHSSARTIEKYREKIMQKLDIHSVADLTRFAIAKGFIEVK